MSAEWTITGLTYDRDKAERRVDGNNPQVSCPVLFSAQCASFPNSQNIAPGFFHFEKNLS